MTNDFHRSSRDSPPLPPSLGLGRYPTPVERVGGLSTAGSDLWVKRDDLTHPVYGGNKVRKLDLLLAQALARGARRIVTAGAAGSHHVLATACFGKGVGLEVEAVLVAQPRTPHVVEVLRASVAQGLRPHPVASWGAVPFAVAARLRAGSRFVPVGGSSVAGSMGFVHAASELAAQVRDGALPEPDVCVVALGSGGTAGGLAAGFEVVGLRTCVVGVCVSVPPWLLRLVSRMLARACARRAGIVLGGAALRRRLSFDVRFLGPGYGHPTAAGDAATRVAFEEAGLVLDPTYTAKAFASALWHVRSRRARHILYWHTLSSAPMGPLLEGALPEESLDPALLRLVR